jgi:hypothetical protein
MGTSLAPVGLMVFMVLVFAGYGKLMTRHRWILDAERRPGDFSWVTARGGFRQNFAKMFSAKLSIRTAICRV